MGKTSKAIADILDTCRRHGKRAGCFSASPQDARKFADQGFEVVIATYDIANCIQPITANASAFRNPTAATPPAAAYGSSTPPQTVARAGAAGAIATGEGEDDAA